MRVRWFGPPWPSEEERAPICEDDAYRVFTPIGIRCIGCEAPVELGERGIVMAYGGEGERGVTYHLDVGETFEILVCAEHIDCLIRATVGPDVEAPPRRP